MKKISRCARNDNVGDGYPVHHTKNVWGKHVSRIVIPSEVEGSFSLATRGRASDGEKRETPYHGKWKRRVSRIVIPSEVEGSFSLAVRRRVFEKEKWETPCRGKAGAVLSVNGLAKKSGEKGTKKISRCARNDSVGDGYPVHHTKNVWEKHVSRIVIGSGAEGSFSLAVRRRASDGERLTERNGKHRIAGRRSVMAIKKEGGSLFFFISMAAQAAPVAHLRYLRSRLRRGERALRGCRSRRRRRCRGDGCHARHLRHSQYHRS